MLSKNFALALLAVCSFAARVREDLQEKSEAAAPWDFSDSLALVRTSIQADLQALETEIDGLSPRALEDMCISCEAKLRASREGKQVKCETPFCDIAERAAAAPVVKIHLDHMAKLRTGKAMFREACKDIGMCGIEGNLLLDTQLPAAKEIRREALKRLHEEPGDSISTLCRECKAHVGNFLSADECQVRPVNFGMGSILPACKPERYCGTTGLTFSSAACFLPDEVKQQREMPLDKLRQVAVPNRKVSPLLVEAAGGPEIPWLHHWAKSTSEEEACELVGMCGNDESAFSRKLQLREHTVERMVELKEYFETHYEKELFFKDFMATWKTVRKMSEIGKTLFKMRHEVEDQLRGELLASNKDLMHAMSQSGFFDSMPVFLTPVVRSAMESMSEGRPERPQDFLEALARGFAVRSKFGDAAGARKSLTMLAAEIGYPSVNPVDVELAQASSLMQVTEADPATLSSTEVGVVYGSVWTLCATLAIYSKNVEYVVYCGAWPGIVGYLYHRFSTALDSLKLSLGSFERLKAATDELLENADFKAVMGEAMFMLVGEAMQGRPVEGGIQASTLVVTRAIEDIDFGDINKIIKDDRVKNAVRDAIRDGITKLEQPQNESFHLLIPDIFKSEGHKVGEALFEVAAEDNPILSASVTLLEDALKEVKEEGDNVSKSDMLIKLLAHEDSPLLDIIAKGSTMLVTWLHPELADQDVPFVDLLKKPDVQNSIQEALRKVEEPFTAARILGRLMASEDLRNAIIKRAFEFIAPGLDMGQPQKQVTQVVQQALFACAVADAH